MNKAIFLFVLLSIFAFSSVSAELFFSDSFDYGDTRDNIQDVSPWNTTSGVLDYDPAGLSHTGMPGPVGGSFHHDHTGGNRAITRSVNIDKLGGAVEGDEFWLTGLIQLANHDGQSRVVLNNDSIVGDLGFGIDLNGNVQVMGSVDGSAGGDWHNTGETAAADGSTYLFLVQAIRGVTGDGDSTINFWFDPQDTSSVGALGSPTLTDSASKFGRDNGVFDQVQISISYQSRADEIRFGDSFNAVMIPEPGTLALVGIALGSLLLFRRRGK